MLRPSFPIAYFTNSMQKNPSCEANSCLVRQGKSAIYGTRGSITVSTPAHHCPLPQTEKWSPYPTILFMIQFNTILPSTPRSSKNALSLRLPYQIPAHISILSQCLARLFILNVIILMTYQRNALSPLKCCAQLLIICSGGPGPVSVYPD
jgi:hypothetical protein